MTDTAQFQDIVDHVTPETLRALAELPAPVVSFYVPTARHRPESERAALELRAMLEPAADELVATGLSAQEAQEILAPVRALQEDPPVWDEQADGLAIFASPDGMRTFRLARSVEPARVTGAVAHLVPLVPIAAGDDRFVVLALSQRQVRLFDATPHSITPMPLGDTPADIDDMDRRNVRQSQLQHQHQPRPGAGGQTAGHHGHGADVSSVQLEKFVREVAAGVREAIGRHAAPPLVLAAVEEYLPRLTETGLLPTLLDDVVAGNPDATAPADLLERSREIAVTRLDAATAERRERAEELVGTGRATVDPGSVLTAAQEGRVGELLIDPDAEGIAGHDAAADATSLDEAVAAALLTGAELHHVPDLADSARFAALLRY